MYVNRKIISVETVPGMGRGMKEMVEWVNSNMIYLIYCKNFCKCHNVSPTSTTTKKQTNRKCLDIFSYNS
jgi:hypothetical protein